jgi:alkylhydroperoxidase family enzyme
MRSRLGRKERPTRRLPLPATTSKLGRSLQRRRSGFARPSRLHRTAAEITDDFFAELKQHFTNPQLIELIATASAFELFPRLVDALRIPITPAPDG